MAFPAFEPDLFSVLGTCPGVSQTAPLGRTFLS